MRYCGECGWMGYHTKGKKHLCPSCGCPTETGAERFSWMKDDSLISDDYVQISAWCPNGCGKTMQVVRPGKFQCQKCG